MSLVEAHRHQAHMSPLCQAWGVSRASFYRCLRPPKPAPPRERPRHALSRVEQQAVSATLHEPRFVDLAHPQVNARLLEEGRYLCSIRTRYHLLAAHGEVRERRAVAHRLIAATCAKQQIAKSQLTLHADRGSSMCSKTVAELVPDLAVTQTHSRPHVSNDNPLSESQFKTLQYRPTFPKRFGSIPDSRSFARDFFPGYNHEHRHCGVALYRPADVHYGRVKQIHQQRQMTRDAAYRRHANRFVRKPPRAALPSEAVWINPPANPKTQARN